MGQTFCPSGVMVLMGKRNMKQMILQVIMFMVYTKKRNGEVHEKGLQREPDLGRVVGEGFMEEVPLELNPNTF